MTPLHLSAILAASGLALAIVLVVTAPLGPLDPGAALRIGSAAHRSLRGQLSAAARAALVTLAIVLALSLGVAHARGLALWPIALAALGGAFLSLGVSLGAARASCFTVARLVGARSRGVLLSITARGATANVAGAAALGLLVGSGLAITLPKSWPSEAFSSLALALVTGAALPQLVLSRPLVLVSDAVDAADQPQGLDHTTLVRFVAASGSSAFVASGFAFTAALLASTLLASATLTHGDEALIGGFSLLVPPLGAFSALLGIGSLGASETEDDPVAWTRCLVVASTVFIAGLWSLAEVVPDDSSAASLAAFSTLLLLLFAVVSWFTQRSPKRRGSYPGSPLLTALFFLGAAVGLAVALGGQERLVSVTDLLAALGGTALGAGLLGMCLEYTWRTLSGLDAATLLATEGDGYRASAVGAEPTAAVAWARLSLSLVALLIGAIPLALGAGAVEHLVLGGGLAAAGFAGLAAHSAATEHTRALGAEPRPQLSSAPPTSASSDDAARLRPAPSLALVQELLERASERGTAGYVAWLMGPALAIAVLGRASSVLGGVLGAYVFSVAVLDVATTAGPRRPNGGFLLPQAALAIASWALLLRAAIGMAS